MIDDESLCILRDDSGWVLTAAFRNGTANSVLAVDVGNEDEYRAMPDYMRAACWPVSTPCVTIQAASLALIRDPHYVRCFAHWLLRAAAALEEMP
jgi:hypothetical protein